MTVPLFHPRRQRWQDHFEWSKDGEQVIGRTAVGRSTIIALQLNRELVVNARRLWLSAGASLQITEKMKANLAYTHIFFKEGDIDRTESAIHFVGKSNAHMDILSAGLSVDF